MIDRTKVRGNVPGLMDPGEREALLKLWLLQEKNSPCFICNGPYPLDGSGGVGFFAADDPGGAPSRGAVWTLLYLVCDRCAGDPATRGRAVAKARRELADKADHD